MRDGGKSQGRRVGLLAIAFVAGWSLAFNNLAVAGPTLWTGKPDYSPEETATIYGSGFGAGQRLTLRVTRPDGSVVTGDGTDTPGSDVVATDPNGALVYPYRLNGIAGAYVVEAIDSLGAVLAGTTFTDSPGAIWTTDPFHDPQNNHVFYKGQSVWIRGEGLDPNATLSYRITDGTGGGAPIAHEGFVSTDSQGNLAPDPSRVWEIPLDYVIQGNGQFKITVFSAPAKSDNFAILERVTLPDFGDAPDPPYPSLNASHGAQHLDITQEWLGLSADGEEDSRQGTLDNFDDGVIFDGPFVPHTPVGVNVLVSTSGLGAARYDPAFPTKRLYLNAWADWNGDGDWDDLGEKIIGTGSPTGQVAIDPPTFGANSRWLAYTVTPPASPADLLYVRFRLDYGQDAGFVTDGGLEQSRGPAQFGEVEDYKAGLVTLITLSRFTATGRDGQVVLEWVTKSEIDHAGFNLWRSTRRKKGPFIQLNPALVPAQGSPTRGATYSFIDAEVRNGVRYYYRLEDIDLEGVSTLHGKEACTFGEDRRCRPIKARPRRKVTVHRGERRER